MANFRSSGREPKWNAFTKNSAGIWLGNSRLA